MERLMLTVILVCIFCGVNQAAEDGQNKGNTRCEVTAVHWGGEGQLTCHYPMDLDKWPSILNVVVQQFVGRSEIHILDCLWDGIYQCTDVRQGYKITKAAGNIMTVTKANVSREQEGRYRCVLIDATGVYGFEFCNSTVTGFFTPSPESETGADEAAAGQPAGVIAAIVICTILFIVILVFVLWLCRKRRGERTKRHIIRSTLEREEMITGNGGMAAEETGDKDRNGTLCSGGSGSGFADTKNETEAAVTLLNEDDDGRSERIGPSVAEIIKGYGARDGRHFSDKDNSSSVRLIGIRDFKGQVPTVKELDSALMDTQTRSGAATRNPADITERNDPSTDRSLTDQSEGAEDGAEVKEDETNEITATLESPGDALQPESILKQDRDEAQEDEEEKDEGKEKEKKEEEKEMLPDSSRYSVTPRAGARSDGVYAQKPENSTYGLQRKGHAGQRYPYTYRYPGQAHHTRWNNQGKPVRS